MGATVMMNLVVALTTVGAARTPVVGWSNPAAGMAALVDYYFCYAYDPAVHKVWVTSLRPAGPDLAPLVKAWIEHVKASYLKDPGQNGAQCDWGGADAMATDRKFKLSQYQSARKAEIVEVDWSYWKDAETPEAAARLNEVAAAGQYVLCFSDASQSPFYLSADLHLDVPPGPSPHSTASDGGRSARALDDLKREFLEYLKADRGYKTSSAYAVSCAGSMKTVADVALKRDQLHQGFHQLTFVETGWKPGIAPRAVAAAPPAPPRPSAAQTAYEKALAAQRPASATPAPAAAPPAPADPPGNFSFCSDMGHPPHGPREAARSVFYLSAIFPADLASQARPAFAKMLQAAHPQENVGAATCTAPQPMAATRAARESEISARKNNPYITVAQIDWKP